MVWAKSALGSNLPWRAAHLLTFGAVEGKIADYQLATKCTFANGSSQPLGRAYTGPQADLVEKLVQAGIAEVSGRDCHGERGKTSMYDIHVYTSPTAPPRVVFRTEECGVIERYVGQLDEQTINFLSPKP